MKLQQYLRYSYLAGLGVVMIGMTFLDFLISAGLLFLVVVWLFNAIAFKDFKQRFNFKNSKALLAFISIYLLYLVGLAWTSNFEFAATELLAKAPILILPIVIATNPKLNVKEMKWLCWVYFGAVIIGSFLALYSFLFEDFKKVEELVWFNSYSVFGLNLALSVILCVWIIKPLELYRNRLKNYKSKIIYAVLILWFLVILVILKDKLALAILAVTASFIVARFLFYFPSIAVRWGIVALGVFMVGYIIFFAVTTYQDLLPKETKILTELDVTTSRGGIYTHDVENKQLENGYWVYIYVCEPEMKEAWEKRSAIAYDARMESPDNPDDYWILNQVLIRFLTGKGWRKDAESVEALTDAEVFMIEHGVANHKYLDNPAPLTVVRILLWEIHAWRSAGIESGESDFFTSYLSWESAWRNIKENFWFGVGTGDALDVQTAVYEESGSTLTPSTPHNQFLAVWLSLGVIGALWFLFAWIYPGVKTGKFHVAIYLAFFVAMTAAMFTGEILLTMSGTAIFALFNALFLFAAPDEL